MENEERNKKYVKIVTRVVASVALIVLILFLSVRAVEHDAIRMIILEFKLLGVLFISLLSGFNVVIPIPAVAFLPLFIESGLFFWPTVATMTLGMTAGDSIGYLFGSTGRMLTQKRMQQIQSGRVYRFLESFRTRHRMWPYILLAVYVSFVPAPNELLVIPMAFIGYRLVYMMLIVFIGNFVFNTLAAFGLISLVGFL